MKGYKGFDKNLCCRGFQYEVGKSYELGENEKLDICNCGFHFCKKMSWAHEYYSLSNKSTRICEIEALGDVQEKDNKCVTDKIKIVRELSREEIEILKNDGFENTGVGNTGDWNTGDWNTGDCNTGGRNTGDCNTGSRNTGDCNTGGRNTGYWNTGYRNTGDSNTGDSNTGYSNTGDRNTENWNTGDCNTGDCNTGDRNTGNWNTGDWNKTNRSTGVFCNKESKMKIFNIETDMTFEEWRNSEAYYILDRLEKNKWIDYEDMSEEEKINYESAKTCGGYLREISRTEASKEWWNKLTDEEKKIIFNLPNFDLEVFNDIMELEIKKEEYERIMK